MNCNISHLTSGQGLFTHWLWPKNSICAHKSMSKLFALKLFMSSHLNFSILAIIKACNGPSHRWFCGVLQIAFYSWLHRFGHCPLTNPVKSILEGFLTFTPCNESYSLAILIRHVSINIKFTAQKLQWHTRYENEWRKHIKMVTNYPFFPAL